jgi:hypothetical protein
VPPVRRKPPYEKASEKQEDAADRHTRHYQDGSQVFGVFPVTIDDRDNQAGPAGEAEAAETSALQDVAGPLDLLPRPVQPQRGRPVAERRGWRLLSLACLDAGAST